MVSYRSSVTGLREDQESHRRDCQDQGARGPPVRVAVAAQSAPKRHDRGGEATERAEQGNGERQQSAGAAPEDLDGRRGHCEEEHRCEGGKRYMADEGGHDVIDQGCQAEPSNAQRLCSLQVIRAESSPFRYASEHTGADLFTIMKGEHEIRPVRP